MTALGSSEGSEPCRGACHGPGRSQPPGLPGEAMIVVTAATGEFGRLVVDSLVNRVPAGEVAVAVRNPGKAEDLAGRGVQIRFGEYDEPGSLREAFAGVDRLLFISSPDIGAREDQHRNVVTAARDAGVGLLVYTSGLGADVIDEGVLGEHHATELLIGDSGLCLLYTS